MSGTTKYSGGNGAGTSRRWQPTTGKRHPKGLVKADINVTPLVDVVLVLLIIFMVITPMIARGVNVDLPITAHHDTRNDDNKDIIVSINKEADIFVNTDKVTLDRLTLTVADQRRRTPNKGVFLKADQRIEYGVARQALEAIHKAGIDDIQLGTDEKKAATP
jgi:biopolymer transport protein ExbD/biopolymer transport protein TolR